MVWALASTAVHKPEYCYISAVLWIFRIEMYWYAISCTEQYTWTSSFTEKAGLSFQDVMTTFTWRVYVIKSYFSLETVWMLSLWKQKLMSTVISGSISLRTDVFPVECVGCRWFICIINESAKGCRKKNKFALCRHDIITWEYTRTLSRLRRRRHTQKNNPAIRNLLQTSSEFVRSSLFHDRKVWVLQNTVLKLILVHDPELCCKIGE